MTFEEYWEKNTTEHTKTWDAYNTERNQCKKVWDFQQDKIENLEIILEEQTKLIKVSEKRIFEEIDRRVELEQKCTDLQSSLFAVIEDRANFGLNEFKKALSKLEKYKRD